MAAINIIAPTTTNDIRRSTDGTTWFAQNKGGTNRFCYSVTGIADNDIWIGGEWYSFHWNGSSWTEYDMGQGADLRAHGVAALRTDYVWFAGMKVNTNNPNNARILRWNGSSFQNFSIPSEAAELLDIWVFDENLAFAVGETDGNPGDSLILGWDGVSWSTVFRGATSRRFNGVWGSAADDVWAIGADTIFNKYAYYWNGLSWADRSATVVVNRSMNKCDGANTSNIWEVSTSIGVGYIRKWNGASWVQQWAGGGSSGLTGVFAVDSSVVYVAGVGGRIMRTINGGSSWSTLVSGTASPISAIGGFWDFDPPYLQNQNPAALQTEVVVDTNIDLEVVDDFSGVDDSTVIITINGTIAWTGDAQQPGFSITKSVASPNGYKYEINPDAVFNAGSFVTVEVYAEDFQTVPSVNVMNTFYQFWIEHPTPVEIDFVKPIAKDVLLVKFTGPVSTAKGYSDPASYTIEVLNKGIDITVEEVLPVTEKAAYEVYLVVSRHNFGDRYRLTIENGMLADASGGPVENESAEWISHRTKVDSVVDSLAGLYSTKLGTNLRGLIQGVTISDEFIGGEEPNERVPTGRSIGGNWGTFYWGSGNWGG